MSRDILRGPFRHGLTFIATLAFVISFFGSRLFATLFPTTVVMQGGIHLHHFWYGIALISVAGWMGIAWRNERLYRLYAVLYGLGAGFVGDEVGLLLTFNNYQSELTYLFFIAAISFVIIATLFPVPGPVEGRTSQTELPRTSRHDRRLPYRFLRFLLLSLVRCQSCRNTNSAGGFDNSDHNLCEA